MEQTLKVVILAGGFGTRLGELTEKIPKPMVTVGGEPILIHIMKRYAMYGFNEFVIALGYKKEVIKQYFLNFRTTFTDLTVDLSNNEISFHNDASVDWKITLVDTGVESMTGGRLLRLKDHIGSEAFMLTYGDGLADVNFKEELAYHQQNKKMVTVCAVRPSARFGELDIENGLVKKFKEKPQVQEGWINGGFFIMEPEFLNFIENDSTVLEKEPLEEVSRKGQLQAYQHDGFWQCVDTRRDKDLLDTLYQAGNAPWMRNEN